jgi:hypothetical protein
MAKEEIKNRKIFLWAAIAGLLIAFFSIFGSIPNYLLKNMPNALSAYSIVLVIVVDLISCFFLFGFYYLGKKYNNKFLKGVMFLFIIFILISLLVQLFYVRPEMNSFSSDLALKVNNTLSNLEVNSNADLSQVQSQVVFESLKQTASQYVFLFSLIALYFIFFIVLLILWGVGLLKLKEKVALAKTTGILKIIAGSTIILFGIGALLNLVAFVFELIILFKEAGRK